MIIVTPGGKHDTDKFPAVILVDIDQAKEIIEEWITALEQTDDDCDSLCFVIGGNRTPEEIQWISNQFPDYEFQLIRDTDDDIDLAAESN
jgi:hypothetical protein